MPTPKLSLVTTSGHAEDVSTIPPTGLATAAESLPVVLAQGVRPIQKFVTVPQFDGTNNATLLSTCVLVAADNPNRRFLKILNNSNVDIELWTTSRPTADQVGRLVKRGEIIFSNGGGLLESGERISSIYATAPAAAELVVIEG